MTDVASLVGLTRSLAIYYGRPWRIGRMARWTKAADMRSWLRARTPGEPSGDVYARRR